MKTKEMFIEFLKMKDVYEEYVSNFCPRYSDCKSLKEFFEYYGHYRWILMAFEWEESVLHYSVWDDLHNQWDQVEVVKNNKLNAKIHRDSEITKNYIFIGRKYNFLPIEDLF